MSRNFKQWLEEQDYNSWLQQNLNMDMKDFAEIGNTWLPSNTFEKDDQKMPNLTPYRVLANKDGTLYKLIDMSQPDPHDTKNPKIPYGNLTHKGRKEYLITKDDYQKLALFPKQPQQPQM